MLHITQKICLILDWIKYHSKNIHNKITPNFKPINSIEVLHFWDMNFVRCHKKNKNKHVYFTVKLLLMASYSFGDKTLENFRTYGKQKTSIELLYFYLHYAISQHISSIDASDWFIRSRLFAIIQSCIGIKVQIEHNQIGKNPHHFHFHFRA